MKFLRLNAVMEQTGLARSTIYKFMDAGTFPKSIPLTARAVAWLESEILEWMEEKLAERG